MGNLFLSPVYETFQSVFKRAILSSSTVYRIKIDNFFTSLVGISRKSLLSRQLRLNAKLSRIFSGQFLVSEIIFIKKKKRKKKDPRLKNRQVKEFDRIHHEFPE